MTKFDIETVELWPHQVTYTNVEADTLEKAIERVSGTDVDYDSHETLYDDRHYVLAGGEVNDVDERGDWKRVFLLTEAEAQSLAAILRLYREIPTISKESRQSIDRLAAQLG